MPDEYRQKLSKAHKGIRLTSQQKIKIGNALRGRRHTPEAIQRMRIAQGNRAESWKKKIGEAKLGDKNPIFGKRGAETPNWKGGITPKNLAIRNSRPFQNWRKAIFTRDDYTCRHCGLRGGELHAHHIRAFSRFPEKRFDLDNGLTLCVPCHKKTDNYAGKA